MSLSRAGDGAVGHLDARGPWIARRSRTCPADRCLELRRGARACFVALLACYAWSATAGVQAVELPPSCLTDPVVPDTTTSLAELRARVEAQNESDPMAAMRLMCATIPRVAREHGEDSVELAWWVGSLAMPLIAYLDKHAEALPLLEFAQGTLERRLGSFAPELAEIHVAYAWIYFRQGRLAESGAAWENALRIRGRSPGPRQIELQKVLVGLAHVRMAQRDFAGTRQALDRAYAILEQNGETVSEAASAIENAFTNLALREEDYVSARRHAETQVSIELQLSAGASQAVAAYVMLGQILARLDEFEESERVLREAFRLADAEDGPLQRHHLPALTQLGRLLNERGKPGEALPFHRRALELAEATLGPDAPMLMRVLQNLAEAQRALGALPEALHLYERAATIFDRHAGDVELQILTAHYRGWGGLLLSLGEPEQARAILNRGLATAGRDPTLSTERAAVLLALAEISRGADNALSRDYLEEALGLFRARLPDSHPTILRAINGLCALEVAETPADAPACADAARRIETAREVEPSLRQAVYENQSALADRRGDDDEAYRLALRALAAAAALGVPDPLWRANSQVARLLQRRGDRALAIFFGKQSLQQIERLRGYFVGEDRRLDRGFLQDKVAVYRTVADWLMEEGRIDEGLEVLRLLKKEELYDFVLRSGTWTDRGSEVALTSGEQALLERYTRMLDADAGTGEELDRLSRLLETGRISVQERERLESLLAGQREAEAARAGRIHEFIAQGRASGGQAVPVRPRTVRAERLERDLRRFGPDSAIAFYVLTEDHLRLLVATRRAQTETRVPLDVAALQRDIGQFLDGISRRDDVSVAARALYETLARPLDEAARAAGAARLVLWLDGPLRYLPFGALHDGERYLADEYAIQIFAEADGAGDSAAGPSGAALTVRGLGVTQAVAGYQPLLGVADELCYVVRGPITGLAGVSEACPTPAAGNGALRGEGFANEAFTETRLQALLDGPPEFSVLHLGTHFSLRPGNALRSFLVLGDGTKLTLDRIGGLDFTGIELLTLSACQTGVGGAVTADGHEVEGLSAVVQRRGAKRVLASLWHVEDASTASLMRALYAALASGKGGASRALQTAQKSLRSLGQDGRRPYEHPYFWAGFVISGSAP